MFRKTRAFFNPEQFQGWGRTKRYFEGWYFKVVNAAEDRAFAIIPGIAMDEAGKKQAFIQVLDGKKKTAAFHKFDAALFKPKAGIFELNIGNNFFSEHKIILDLPDLKGTLKFSGNIPWPQTLLFSRHHGTLCLCTFHGMLSRDCKHGSCNRRCAYLPGGID
ncbi:MAG: hypothetical protein IPP39_07650 [Chitinophagaceae bacterium]|nr:hypothetical protein [Chitinophagaceae bacterium]